jgi:hypothetical protein
LSRIEELRQIFVPPNPGDHRGRKLDDSFSADIVTWDQQMNESVSITKFRNTMGKRKLRLEDALRKGFVPTAVSEGLYKLPDSIIDNLGRCLVGLVDKVHCQTPR